MCELESGQAERKDFSLPVPLKHSELRLQQLQFLSSKSQRIYRQSGNVERVQPDKLLHSRSELLWTHYRPLQGLPLHNSTPERNGNKFL